MTDTLAPPETRPVPLLTDLDAYPSGVYYRGRRHTTGRPYVDVITIGDDGFTDTRPLPHLMRHSPDGFEWGYGGSGPSDLALAILWHALGREPSAPLYHAFKFAHVATWPNHGWRIVQDDVLAYVESLGEEWDR